MKKQNLKSVFLGPEFGHPNWYTGLPDGLEAPGPPPGSALVSSAFFYKLNLEHKNGVMTKCLEIPLCSQWFLEDC